MTTLRKSIEIIYSTLYAALWLRGLEGARLKKLDLRKTKRMVMPLQSVVA